jgi:hypothetical protein
MTHDDRDEFVIVKLCQRLKRSFYLSSSFPVRLYTPSHP